MRSRHDKIIWSFARSDHSHDYVFKGKFEWICCLVSTVNTPSFNGNQIIFLSSSAATLPKVSDQEHDELH